MKSKSRPVGRRQALAAAGGALAGLIAPAFFKPLPAAGHPMSAPMQSMQPGNTEWEFIQPRPAVFEQWARITEFGTPVRGTPGGDQDVIGFVPFDLVRPVLEVVHAPGVFTNPYNDVWYRIKEGYVYTASVQIIRPYHMPPEIAEIDTIIDEKPGFWAEVIVPSTPARAEPNGAIVITEEDTPTTLVYSSTHRVIESKADDAGFLWYKIKDDKKGAKPFYALARHLRPITPAEVAPINPTANKRIVITLDQQRMDCYEGDTVVLSTLVSSGGSGFDTPRGEHAVVYKQLSRHMYSDPENEAFSDPNFFDLPGVPFNVFFTTLGHAIHGTYWHGDYGRPRSHGCVNVTPEIARWIFRWAAPETPYEVAANGSSAEPGTPVIVL